MSDNAERTKPKIEKLIEKHIITTKIGHLLRALDNCKKTTNVIQDDKSKIYVSRKIKKLNGSQAETSNYEIG